MSDEEFRELYARMSQVVFSYAARRLPPEEARDVVAETFEVLWRKRNDIPLEPHAWPSWVIGIAKNKVLHEYQRTRRKHHDNRFIDDFPSHHNSDPDIADSVTSSIVGRAVWSQLSSEDQELVNLAFVRGLTSASAAAILGISTTAYTTRLTRTRQRLVALTKQASTDPHEPQKSGSTP